MAKQSTDKVKLHGNRVLKIETLGTEAATEVYEMRSNGATYKEIINFLWNNYEFKANIPMLQRFFNKYNVHKSEKDLKDDPAKNQMVRRREMERRIDMISNIIEDQITKVQDDDNISNSMKATKISELSRVMLDTINKDVHSQTGFDKSNSNTNVQVNVGEQLKEVANKKKDLKRAILTAEHKGAGDDSGSHQDSSPKKEAETEEISDNANQETDSQ